MIIMDSFNLETSKNPLDRVFLLSVILKALDGLAELFSGIALLFVKPEQIYFLANILTRKELAEDPGDFIANWILHTTANFSQGAVYFLAAYLLIHATVKLIAVGGILLNKAWAYPFALVALGILTLYQIFEVTFVHPSIWLIILTVFDVFLLWLIWHEYKARFPHKKAE